MTLGQITTLSLLLLGCVGISFAFIYQMIEEKLNTLVGLYRALLHRVIENQERQEEKITAKVVEEPPKKKRFRKSKSSKDKV